MLSIVVLFSQSIYQSQFLLVSIFMSLSYFAWVFVELRRGRGGRGRVLQFYDNKLFYKSMSRSGSFSSNWLLLSFCLKVCEKKQRRLPLMTSCDYLKIILYIFARPSSFNSKLFGVDRRSNWMHSDNSSNNNSNNNNNNNENNNENIKMNGVACLTERACYVS